jgi:hypothetical protein
MLREKAKTNRAPFLMGSGGYIGFHYWCESILKSYDRPIYVYVRTGGPWISAGNLCWRLEDAFSRI